MKALTTIGMALLIVFGSHDIGGDLGSSVLLICGCIFFCSSMVINEIKKVIK